MNKIGENSFGIGDAGDEIGCGRGSESLTDAISVQIDGLTVDFGRGHGIFDASISVPRGSVLGLVGRNGAGKTTLVRALTGLIRPDSGRISVEGIDPSTDRASIMEITGYVDEDKALYPWMRIGELLDFTASFHRVWDHSIADAMLKAAGIDRSMKIGELSKGGRAEVALILALAKKPRILVMDEPTSGLDILVRHEFLERLVEFACGGSPDQGDDTNSGTAEGEAHPGTTVIFSSHILEDVERVCDRVAFVEAGRILLHREVDSLRREHALSRPGREPVGLKDIFIEILKGSFVPKGGPSHDFM